MAVLEAVPETPNKTLIGLIDRALSECASRSIVSADVMTDMLLDIRAAASPQDKGTPDS